MDVSAILLVGVAQNDSAASGAAGETVLGVPIATLDVLGRPLVHRVAQHLLASGVSRVAIIANSDASIPAGMRQGLPTEAQLIVADAEHVWREGERIFEELSDSGAELVIVWRLGAYAEIDVETLLQAHLDQGARTTEVCDANGQPLELFVVCGSRRNDAAYLFRHQLLGTRMPGCDYKFYGCCNRLRTAADLRELTIDGLMLRNLLRPVGREIRPGVWVGQGVRIQKGARLVAPCYVGSYSCIRPAAVITRGSTIEHHSEVDCGTVVEGANVLPFSYLGAGLDVCQAVVGYNKIAPLRRPVEVEITDPKLISMASQHAPVRAASTVGALFSFLPLQLIRGLLSKTQPEQPTDLQTALKESSAALREPAAHPIASQDSAKFPNNMIVARRYGNE